MRIILFGLLLLESVASARESYKWQERTENGYSYRYVTGDPMKARFYTLKNGLTVILSENHKEPKIQTLIGVRAGSNNDPETHTGLAHYLEHLLFKGTTKYGTADWPKEKPYIDRIEQLYDLYNRTRDSVLRRKIYHSIDSVSGIAARYAIAGEYDKLLTSMGAQGTNAHTAVDETIYEEQIPASSVDKYLAVQAERFREPVFRIFHTELEAVYEEKNRSLDNDAWRLYESMLSGLFPTHHYGTQTTIGTIDHLKNPSLKAIRKFYNDCYVPGNMAIVMAGDFDPAALIRKIEKAFAYMKIKPVKEYKGPVEKQLSVPVIKEVYGPDAENMQAGFRLPGAADKRATLVMTVISQLLSNGKAGLIDVDLNLSQRVLNAGVSMTYWKDYAIFSLSGKAKQGQHLEEVKELLMAELGKIKSGDFDEKLVKAIVANFKLSELKSLDDNNSRAVTLMDGFIKHRGKDWASDVSFIDDLKMVTKKELMAFAGKWFGNNYVLVYKRQGEKPRVQKVDKPAITPVTLDRTAQSPFAKVFNEIPVTPVRPQWMDFEKDFTRSSAGKAELLYVPNTNNDLFRLYYRFNIGGYHQKLLPLALGYLQYLGTGKMKSEEISRAFYDKACSFGMSPGSENSVISLSGLQENFDTAAELLEELVKYCRADEQALADLKERIKKSRDDSKLSKQNILRGMVQYAIYGEKNPFNYQLSAAELEAVTAGELVELLHSLFSFEHKVIYFGPAPINKLVNDLSAIHQSPVEWKTIPQTIQFNKISNDHNRVLFTRYEMVQAEVNWVRNGEQYDPGKAAATDVFNEYFGGGIGSVVFQSIRESKALAYSTYAYIASPNRKEDRYTSIAYVGCQADKLKEAVDGMNELLDSMPAAALQFENAKRSVQQQIETDRITDDDIVFSYLGAKRLGIDYDIRKAEYEMVDKLEYSAIADLHRQALAGKTFTYCVLGAEKELKPEELGKMGELKVLTLDEIFGY